MKQEKKPATPRVFFGIPITEEKGQMFSEKLISENPKLKHQVRWTRPGNHHITLRFLGNIEAEKIPDLIELTSKSANEIDSFNVIPVSITLFPVHYGQLSAVNIQPSVELQNLYNTISFCVKYFDFLEENRPYLPHITLFRAKKNKPIELERILLNKVEIQVTEFILYQSISVPGGSEYKPLHRFQLKA